MKSYPINPTHEFKNELMCIQNPLYMKIAVDALNKAPDYVWFVPASSSGKYHPKSSLGMGGLIRHVKAVFWISEALLQHPLYAPFTDDEKDAIRVAIILHDMCKQGTGNEPSHTLTEHPLLVRDALEPTNLLDEDTDSSVTYAWNLICDLIETHMGIWTKDENGKEILKVPESKMQLFVHMCDYLASQRNIEVDVTPRMTQSADYGKKKDEPATEKQIDYIKKLYNIAHQRGINYPPTQLTDSEGNVVLTKKKASDCIENLKSILGM